MAPLPAKDTTPKQDRNTKYRVLKPTFVNGSLINPTNADGKPVEVVSVAGLHGEALQQIDPPLAKAAATAPAGKSAGGDLAKLIDAHEREQIEEFCAAQVKKIETLTLEAVKANEIIGDLSAQKVGLQAQLAAARAEAEGVRGDLQRAIQRAEDAEAKLAALPPEAPAKPAPKK